MKSLFPLLFCLITSFSFAQLSGAYTIGGANPNYTDHSSVISDLNLLCYSGTGTVLAEITTDLDDELRVTPPYMDSDKFTSVGENAGLTVLDFPSAPFDPGNYQLTTTLHNSGTTDLTSVDIHWEINGVAQTTINWTGTLGFSLSESVVLGSYNFESLIPYEIRAWVSNPNGGTDIDFSNDSLAFQNIYTTIGGSLTIGGNDPDFLNFTEATDALNYGGLNAAVAFDVRDGIYEEQISLGEIYNNNASNTITFQSASADSSAVILQFDSPSSSDYIVRLLGTDFVSLRNLGLKPLSTNYANVLVFENGAMDLLVENCHFEGDLNSGKLIYSSTDNDNNTTIRNNYFHKGADAISLRGVSNMSPESGLSIENNIFEETYSEAIYLLAQNAPRVNYNEITSENGQLNSYKVRFNFCNNGLQAIGNKIISSKAYYGIAVENSTSTLGNEALITNNFISLKRSSGGAYGIHQLAGSYMNFYYNSVQIQSDNEYNSRAFNSDYGTNVKLKNNIFANIGGGYAISSTTPSTITEADHNDYYTTGAVLAYYNSVTQATLSDWQTASSLDANSISIDPLFNSADDLHISFIALQAATPIAGILVDIDGDNRNPVNPFIGADETFGASGDVSLLSIDAPTMLFPHGVNDVYVTLVNNFTTDLNSADIYWEVNGAQQADFAWSGSIPSGGQESINIGSYQFDLGTAHDIKIWLSNPNGVSDIFPVNDTVLVVDLYPALSGTYSIGGQNPDFPNFTTAVAALQYGGIVGPVTFEVADGTYNEQIFLSRIMGSGASNPIIFQSASADSSAVTLTFNAVVYDDNYLVKLIDVEYITFQYMSFLSKNTTYGRVFNLLGNSHHINLFSNHIEGSSINSSNGYLVAGNNNPIEFFVAKGNTFLNGSTAIHLNSNILAEGTEISLNNFINQYNIGIYLKKQNGPTIKANYFSNSTSFILYDAIYLHTVDNDLEISYNKINVTGRYGIFLNRCDGTPSTYQLIANNFISLGGTGITYGINSSYSTYQKHYFNSVNLTSTEATDGQAFHLTGGGNTHLLNNILANMGGGFALYVNTITAVTVSDHNNLYSNGGMLGHWNGNRYSLMSWQAANGKDGNSVSVDPLFTSAADLHVTLQTLSEAGTPVPEVNTDIDSQQRNPLTPDIGADEFTNLAIDPEYELDLKAYLEATFVTKNEMNTGINNDLPLAQPYADYSGTKTLTSIPADMVDWVLVTVRSDANTVLDTLAAVLLDDGQIVGTDGQNLVLDSNLGTIDSLYISVHHRNHLALMSAERVGAVNDVFTHDFSLDAGYGSGAIPLSTGDYGLVSGDANGDGIVNAADRSDTWNARNLFGYNPADVTMNGVVDASDRSRTWNRRNNWTMVP